MRAYPHHSHLPLLQVQDACAALELYKYFRSDWEASFAQFSAVESMQNLEHYMMNTAISNMPSSMPINPSPPSSASMYDPREFVGPAHVINPLSSSRHHRPHLPAQGISPRHSSPRQFVSTSQSQQLRPRSGHSQSLFSPPNHGSPLS